MFKKLLILLFFVSIISIPAQTNAANVCFCYFGEINDCQKVTIDQSTTDVAKECATTCTTTHKDALKNITYTDIAVLSSSLEKNCTDAHNAATTKETTDLPNAVLPELNVGIPGFEFSPILEKGGVLQINLLGEYIQGMYKYLISFSVIIAIVFLMIGGLQWALGGVSSEQISKAKKRISNAVIGLVLLLSVVLILQVVNPQLTTLKPIQLQKVERIEVSYAAQLMNSLEEGTAQLLVGMTEVASMIGDHKTGAAPESTLTDTDIKNAAQQNSIDECFLWAFAKKESGGKLLAIGHDENYNHNNKGVPAREKFLMSGVKYGGETFNPPTSGKFSYQTMNSYSVFNNDTFQPNNPPDYGLDWRLSHGIGYIQLTIVPGKGTMGQQIPGPNGPEWARKVRGKWFTVSDLLNKDTALEATIRFFGPSCGKKSTVVEAMKCGLVSDAAIGRALAKYQKCPLNKTMTISPEDLKQYPAAGSH